MSGSIFQAFPILPYLPFVGTNRQPIDTSLPARGRPLLLLTFPQPATLTRLEARSQLIAKIGLARGDTCIYGLPKLLRRRNREGLPDTPWDPKTKMFELLGPHGAPGRVPGGPYTYFLGLPTPHFPKTLDLPFVIPTFSKFLKL